VPIRDVRDVEVIVRPGAAAALLHPLKATILRLAREPASATELARLLELPRQRVHYHVRELERAGLLRRAGRRRRRNLVEQRFVATARFYVLSPSLLGPLAADWRAVEDASSPDYLLALTEQVRDDVALAAAEAEAAGGRASTFSLKAQFRLESDEQRAAFTAALREALVAAVARHSSPDPVEERRSASGTAAPGQRHRLVLACYPVPGGLPETGGRHVAAGEEPRKKEKS